MSSMDLEAEGARYYELTDYNILHESTWGGGQGAGDRLRAMLRPRTPLLLPASPPLPLSRQRAFPGRLVELQADEPAASGPSRENLKSITSAGLFKVFGCGISRIVSLAKLTSFVLLQVLGNGSASTTLALHAQRCASCFLCALTHNSQTIA